MARRPRPDQIRAAYAALDLAPGTANLKDASRAYRIKARAVHPDHRPAEDRERANAEMAALTAAYEIVQDHIRSGGRLDDVDDVAPIRRTGSRFTIYEVRAPAGAGKTRTWASAMARQPRGRWRTVQPGEILQPGVRVRMNMDTETSEVFEPADDAAIVRQGAFQWPPGFPRHMIYAGPTIDLLREVERSLHEVGITPTVIHSAPGKPLVNVQLARYFRDTRLTDDAVLLITHAALFDMPHAMMMSRKPNMPRDVVFRRAEWDLVIDEPPDVLQFFPESWPLTHRIVSDRVEAFDWSDRLYQLIPQTDAAVTYFQMLGGDIPHDTNIADSTREICSALVSPSRMVLVEKNQWDELAWRDEAGNSLNPYNQMVYGGALDVMVITRPTSISEYRSTTVMGARLDTSMYHLLWDKLFHVAWAEHPLQHQLAPVHRNGRRLRLWYLSEEPPSRELLLKQAAGGGTMFQAFARRVGEFFDPPTGPKPRNRQFIWSAPLDRGSIYGVRDTFFRDVKARQQRATARPGTRPFDPDLRLAGRAAGQNRFRQYHNAVLLNVVNFSPNQWVMLHSLGLTDEQIYRAQAHNYSYQDLLRCSIRETGGRDIVNGIVVSRATALDIGGEFPHCALHEVPDAPKRAAARKRGPKKTSTLDAQEQNRQRQRQWRARQRERKQAMKEAAKQ